jgi:hypothetical protein
MSLLFVSSLPPADSLTLRFNLSFSMLLASGELVEKGIMRRLPEGFDGNQSPYVFTWSNERPNKVILRCTSLARLSETARQKI